MGQSVRHCALGRIMSTPVRSSLDPLRITTRPGLHLTVTGRLDLAGIEQLHERLQAALGDGIALLVVDLSAVSECAERLFAVLADIHTALRAREGWMRLAGLSPAALNALDTAPIPEILMVYRNSDLAPERRGIHDTTMIAINAEGTDGAQLAVVAAAVSVPRHAADP